MRKINWVILFLLVLTGNIAGMYMGSPWLEKITKPLLMIVMIIYFVFSVNKISSAYKRWIITALAFSWLGDVLLMFQQEKPIFFLFGLSAFLIAHIFYILFFHQVKVNEQVRSRWWLLAIVVIYYAVLMAVLYPKLGDMKVPVPVYGIVISFMLLLAMHMLFIKNSKAGQLMMTGAVLFILSDSILAINKFYQPFEAAGFLIMLTYGIAQLLITKGAIAYIHSK
jgi:uncharacterized membrane protein YhhN